MDLANPLSCLRSLWMVPLDEKTGLCLAINASDLDDIISDEKIDRDELSKKIINIHEDLINLVIEKRKEEKREMQIFYCFQCDASIEANMIKVISQILFLARLVTGYYLEFLDLLASIS